MVYLAMVSPLSGTLNESVSTPPPSPPPQCAEPYSWPWETGGSTLSCPLATLMLVLVEQAMLLALAAVAGPAMNASGHTLSAAPTRQIRRFTATSEVLGMKRSLRRSEDRRLRQSICPGPVDGATGPEHRFASWF